MTLFRSTESIPLELLTDPETCYNISYMVRLDTLFKGYGSLLARYALPKTAARFVKGLRALLMTKAWMNALIFIDINQFS